MWEKGDLTVESKKALIIKGVKSRFGKYYHMLPPSIRYGKQYKKLCAFLDESQYWRPEQIAAYQMEKLKKTLVYAYQYCPYYTKLFREIRFNPNEFRNVEQLKQIPYLTKEIIQEHLEELKSTNMPDNKMHYFTTGGSTGIPMGFYQTKYISAKETAFIHDIWKRVGYQYGDRLVVLRGAYTGEKGFFIRESGNLIVSSYHMTDANIKTMIEAIRRYRPKYMHAYPSAAYILCDYMRKLEEPPFETLKAVLAASENLYPYQREMIEQTLKCRVMSHYGHSECACLAGECELSEDYHIYWQYGYTEIIKENGKAAGGDLDIGEIVATTFDNYAMPLIRYRTMDIATIRKGKCKCGRNYELIKHINGRLQEVLLTKTGQKISMTAMNMHSNVFDHVYQFQFYQDNLDYCIFNIVKRETYTEDDEKKIYNELKKKIGGDLELKIEYVDHIPRTQSGKYRFLIQKLPLDISNEGED